MLLTACSSSEKAAAGGDSAGIHIGIVADVSSGALGTGEPEAPQAANAGVAAVNKSGGINGKKLVLTVCDAKCDPNQTTTCARNLAADKSIVAVVGSTSIAAPLEPRSPSARRSLRRRSSRWARRPMGVYETPDCRPPSFDFAGGRQFLAETKNVDVSTPSTILGGKFPRLVGHSVYLVRIENGQPVLLQADPVSVG